MGIFKKTKIVFFFYFFIYLFILFCFIFFYNSSSPFIINYYKFVDIEEDSNTFQRILILDYGNKGVYHIILLFKLFFKYFFLK
jgi:hypothetical protein